ncbi:hypothetical protein TD95_003494 [Thielaviopsis punctulata]|uniref:L-type lectin-like domain-containing protein n=1 Tax=Thielaviopsis punctulata TaxID=72032 RepID=A0A0F4ZKR8_9PEZI|nr:hypothetical protein TD95_003494 [Thielaviopsis punctulata]
MRFHVSAALSAALLSGLADAQFLLNDFSFGYSGRIQSENGQIPNFRLRGNPEKPEILSNRLILTPPAPGNQKTSIWANSNLLHPTWVADVDFRASGPERGSGNINIWLAENGPDIVDADSVYGAKNFKGLVIVVDSSSGAGMIRGFLNDGSKDFSREHNVDSLAFGNCFYAYRNLGRPSQIKLRQDPGKFRVEVDGGLCFETDKVRIPTGYRLGVSATTGDTADSIELFKVVVMSDSVKPPDAPPVPQQQQQQSDQQQQQQQINQADSSMPGAIPDVSADSITDTTKQFADLHDRIQAIDHHVISIYQKFAQNTYERERQTKDFMLVMENFRNDMRAELGRFAAAGELLGKIGSLEAELKRSRLELQNMIRTMEHQVTTQVGQSHSTLADNLTTVHSNHGRLVYIIIGSQLVLVAVYLAYKRKGRTQHIKYL